MGKIYEEIKKDRDIFLKNRDGLALSACRLIIGEIQRDPNKDQSDSKVIVILKSLKKMAENSPDVDYLLIDMINRYIPNSISDIEVIRWVKDNNSYNDIINMGKKAYSIIGLAKKHFKDNEINAVCIKEFIDNVIERGIHVYIDGGIIKPVVIDEQLDVMVDLFESVCKKRVKKVIFNELYD